MPVLAKPCKATSGSEEEAPQSCSPRETLLAGDPLALRLLRSTPSRLGYLSLLRERNRPWGHFGRRVVLVHALCELVV